MANSSNSNARSIMSFDETDDSSDENNVNDYFSKSIAISNDTYYDNISSFDVENSNSQMVMFTNSSKIELPSINNLLDLNSNELVFESADTLAVNTANETATTSVSSGVSEPSIAVDFTIGQVQALNDNMQIEAMFHIM